MTLSHVQGDTGYGELYMEVVSRSNKESINPSKRRSHPADFDQMVIQGNFDQSMNIRNSF